MAATAGPNTPPEVFEIDKDDQKPEGSSPELPNGWKDGTQAYIIQGRETADEAGEEAPELSKAEQAKQIYDEITDAAMESSFTPAQRKAVTQKKKHAHQSRIVNKPKKRANRNRKGVTKR